VGPSVDNDSARLVSSSDSLLYLSEALDPIMELHGFEFSYREKSYQLLPHKGKTFTSSYLTKRGTLSWQIRCLVRVDLKNIDVSFEVSESEPRKSDFPPEDEVRQDIDDLIRDIVDFFRQHCPNRAVEVSKLHWPQTRPGEDQASQSSQSRQGYALIYGIGAACISGMAYYFGKEHPTQTQYYYLIGAINYSLLPKSSMMSGLSRFTATLWCLGMARLNHYYATHPERSKKEAGWANVAGLWGGGFLLALTLPRNPDSLNPTFATSLIPHFSHNEVGLIYTIRF